MRICNLYSTVVQAESSFDLGVSLVKLVWLRPEEAVGHPVPLFAAQISPADVIGKPSYDNDRKKNCF
jgi:hypothetical protein